MKGHTGLPGEAELREDTGLPSDTGLSGIQNHQEIQEERCSNNRATKRVAQFPIPTSFVEPAQDIHEELGGFESVSESIYRRASPTKHAFAHVLRS